MLPLEWASHLRAKPGCLLIERLEEPYQYEGLIWIPDRVRQGRRPPFAKVVSVHPTVAGLGIEEGMTVAVSPAAGQRVVFGDTTTQRTIYNCYPSWCFFAVRDGKPEDVDELGEGLRGLPEDDPRLRMAVEGRAEHGIKK